MLETNDRFNGEIADYSSIFKSEDYRKNLTWRITHIVDCGYMFVTYNFLKYIGEENYETDWDYENRRETYKIADGKHVYMSGF